MNNCKRSEEVDVVRERLEAVVAGVRLCALSSLLSLVLSSSLWPSIMQIGKGERGRVPLHANFRFSLQSRATNRSSCYPSALVVALCSALTKPNWSNPSINQFSLKYVKSLFVVEFKSWKRFESLNLNLQIWNFSSMFSLNEFQLELGATSWWLMMQLKARNDCVTIKRLIKWSEWNSKNKQQRQQLWLTLWLIRALI